MSFDSERFPPSLSGPEPVLRSWRALPREDSLGNGPSYSDLPSGLLTAQENPQAESPDVLQFSLELCLNWPQISGSCSLSRLILTCGT